MDVPKLKFLEMRTVILGIFVISLFKSNLVKFSLACLLNDFKIKF